MPLIVPSSPYIRGHVTISCNTPHMRILRKFDYKVMPAVLLTGRDPRGETSSELGTYKRVRTKFRSWLSFESPLQPGSCFLFARKRAGALERNREGWEGGRGGSKVGVGLLPSEYATSRCFQDLYLKKISEYGLDCLICLFLRRGGTRVVRRVALECISPLSVFLSASHLLLLSVYLSASTWTVSKLTFLERNTERRIRCMCQTHTQFICVLPFERILEASWGEVALGHIF